MRRRGRLARSWNQQLSRRLREVFAGLTSAFGFLHHRVIVVVVVVFFFGVAVLNGGFRARAGRRKTQNSMDINRGKASRHVLHSGEKFLVVYFFEITTRDCCGDIL